DDLHDAVKIHSVITTNPQRVVDNLVVSQKGSIVRTALVVGPLIYGVGRGPVNQRSIQAPEIARVTLQRKKGFRLGKGLNVWSNVHVHDLSDLFAKLLDAALTANPDVWNDNGVYFPENGKLVSYTELIVLVIRLTSSPL